MKEYKKMYNIDSMLENIFLLIERIKKLDKNYKIIEIEKRDIENEYLIRIYYKNTIQTKYNTIDCIQEYLKGILRGIQNIMLYEED